MTHLGASTLGIFAVMHHAGGWVPASYWVPAPCRYSVRCAGTTWVKIRRVPAQFKHWWLLWIMIHPWNTWEHWQNHFQWKSKPKTGSLFIACSRIISWWKCKHYVDLKQRHYWHLFKMAFKGASDGLFLGRWVDLPQKGSISVKCVKHSYTSPTRCYSFQK